MTTTLEICRNIAHSMREPGSLMDFVDEQIRYGNFSMEEWHKLSLAYGLPGLVCFYTTLDACCPEEGWDKVANEYLQLCIRTLEEEGNSNHSLFFGIGGVCFATYLASKQGTHYQKLLTQLETILEQELERSIFPQIAKCCTYDWHLSPDLYNLMNGVSGCIAYLSLRKDQVLLQKLGLRCLEELVRALSRQRNQCPGWFVEPSHSNIQGEFPHGLYDLSTSFGVTGVLATLSIAAQNELIVPGQLELIRKMADWLKEQQKISDSGVFWDIFTPVEGGSSAGITRDVWDYGVPAVARSLYLASTVLQDPVLGKYAQDCFEGIFLKPAITLNLIATPLTHGRAGLLAITDRMAKDTGSLFLKEQVQKLEEDLLRFYDVEHRYGFRMAFFDERQVASYRWVDSPFFLDGSAGTALSLLSLSSYRILDWQRALLIC